MARDDASVRMTVAQRQALAALNQFQNKFAQMTKSMANNTKRHANEAQKMNATLNSWGRNLKGAALAMAGFGSAAGAAFTVVSLFRKELEIINQTADRSSNRQLSFGHAAMQVAFSLPKKDGNLIDMDIDDITRRLEDERDPTKAMNVFKNIHGANADLSISGKVGVTEALMNSRFDLEEDAMTELGVQVADNHAKALKKGVKSSINAQIGLFEGTKAASKVTDDSAFYGNIAPIGLDLSKFGVNQGEAMLLAAGLTSAANDRTGEESRTGLSKFFSSLEEEKARFGIKETGMELLKSVREGKTAKHKEFQNYMLGVFSDGEDRDFQTMTRSEAALKLEGRSKLKFYLMDLLRNQNADDPSNLRNVMGTIQESGQIPLAYKGDGFQVDMGATMGKSERYFQDKISSLNNNQRVQQYIKQENLKHTASKLEMDSDRAMQKMVKDQFLTIMQDSGVKLSNIHSDIEFYSDQYGSEDGLLEAIKNTRGRVAMDHPKHGVFGTVHHPDYGMGTDIGNYMHGNEMPTEDLKKLTFKRSNPFNRDARGISDEQLRMIESLDELIGLMKRGALNKIEIKNLPNIDRPARAARLGGQGE